MVTVTGDDDTEQSHGEGKPTADLVPKITEVFMDLGPPYPFRILQNSLLPAPIILTVPPWNVVPTFSFSGSKSCFTFIFLTPDLHRFESETLASTSFMPSPEKTAVSTTSATPQPCSGFVFDPGGAIHYMFAFYDAVNHVPDAGFPSSDDAAPIPVSRWPWVSWHLDTAALGFFFPSSSTSMAFLSSSDRFGTSPAMVPLSAVEPASGRFWLAMSLELWRHKGMLGFFSLWIFFGLGLQFGFFLLDSTYIKQGATAHYSFLGSFRGFGTSVHLEDKVFLQGPRDVMAL